MLNKRKHELQNIIRGTGSVRYGANIQDAASYLRASKSSSEKIKGAEYSKGQEELTLEKYIHTNSLWYDPNTAAYVAEGSEQKVFLYHDGEYVIKLNTSLFYSYWEDYLNSLLIHNYLFPDTAYKLLGFIKQNEALLAVVEQKFIISTEETDLSKVKIYMEANGFENNRNNDYINHELGLILEDLHDENVIFYNGNLMFIDTVFYLTDNFYK